MPSQLLVLGLFGSASVTPGPTPTPTPPPIITGTVRADHIQRALEEIGIAAYVYDLSGDELASALRIHEALLLEWAAQGIALGYVPAAAGPALSDPMTTPVWASEAIVTNLAIRLSPQHGKTASLHTRQQAASGKALCVARTLTVTRKVEPRIALRGAGYRRWW